MKYSLTSAQLRELRAYKDTQKVACIKKTREFSGAGLKEAKLFVENGLTIPCEIDGDKWELEGVDGLSISGLMTRLFELTAEIAEIHNLLEERDIHHVKE